MPKRNPPFFFFGRILQDHRFPREDTLEFLLEDDVFLDGGRG